MTSVTGPARLEPAAVRDLLECGKLEIEGMLVEASNATMRALVSLDGVTARCVYKPVRGERPLWDFPDGTLAGREVSAYLVSEATGWGVVPPTVLRDGPLGIGACQLWIDSPDPVEPLVDFVPAGELPAGWHAIAAARDTDGAPYALAHADDPRLAAMAAYDAVINNADRKGGHVLVGADGRVYGVDHGVSFHVEDKLRTVLWGWAGEPLPGEMTGVLRLVRTALDGDLGAALALHLTRAEVRMVRTRVDRLLAAGTYPEPGEGWPAIPWPAV